VVRLGRIFSMIEQVGRKKKGDINTPSQNPAVGSFRGPDNPAVGRFCSLKK
jgi:hypothetical protein